MPPKQMPYNPYEAIERYVRYGHKKSSEPILFDPYKNKARVPQQKHVAPPGSLLRVWDGSLEIDRN